MSRLFVYDGGFQGLLTVVQALRETGEDPDDIVAAGTALQESLLAETVRVEADREQAERLSRDVCSLVSPRALRHSFYAFLSETAGAEYHIYRYLRLGWESGDDVDARMGDEHVYAVHRLSRNTGREAHRMHGFLRFRHLEEGLYYAPMRPDCDVLWLVAWHFLRRMGDQDWMIHDLHREQAAICRQGRLAFVAVPGFDPRLSEQESACQVLWKRYFKDIAVAERRNSRVQMSCMPKKYWDLLVEEPGVPFP